jgi:hypothetical protein
MEKKVITRQDLYEIVWAETVNTISKKFNITEYAIKKVCQQMSIPLPPIGYWSRINHGKAVEKDPLPEDYTGKTEITIPFELDSNPLIAKQKEILNDKRLKLEVTHNLTNPDPLIVEARESLTRKQGSSRIPGQIQCEPGRLNIRVSRDMIGRALRIMDTFIKAVKARGHNVITTHDATYIVVQEERIAFSLKEHLKKVATNDRWRTYDYVGIGELHFDMDRYYPQVICRDGQEKLENKLFRVIAKYELTGELQHLERLERKRLEDIRREQERIRLEFEKRKAEELDDVRELISKANRRYQTEILRNFIDMVEQKAIEDNSVDQQLEEWIKWARVKSDWLDPFIEADDELLEGVDRRSLTFSDWSRGRR